MSARLLSNSRTKAKKNVVNLRQFIKINKIMKIIKISNVQFVQHSNFFLQVSAMYKSLHFSRSVQLCSARSEGGMQVRDIPQWNNTGVTFGKMMLKSFWVKCKISAFFSNEY